jgi:predicted nuclease with TOPRIM domain
MVRKSAKIPVNPAVASTLAITDLRLRLEFLERDRQKLIGKIEKKRTELNNLIDRIREISVEVSQRSAPIMQQLLELDGKMHAVFAEIFTGRKLGKQTRKNIEAVYANLQASGLISPRRRSQPEQSHQRDVTADPPDETDGEWRKQPGSFMFEDESPKLDRDELKKIRQIFLRLAEVFHPDKVSDPQMSKYHTEVMQEINQAYQSGDLAKLLAIEKKYQMGEIIDLHNEDDLLRRCAKIEQENEILQDQFENLKLELRLTKKTQQGSMVTEYRKLAKAGYDPIGELIAQTEVQVNTVAEIYQFVVDFRDRRITIKDFMKGPSSFQVMSEIDEDDLYIEFFG